MKKKYPKFFRLALFFAINLILSSGAYAQLVLNEYGAMPSSGGVGVDPNGDGDLDGVDDEYVELVNTGVSAIDLEGYTLRDTQDRYTFPAGTILPPGGAIVVFSDLTGNLGSGDAFNFFGGSEVHIAGNSLSFSNAGDHIEVQDESDVVVATTVVDYGAQTQGESESLIVEADYGSGYATHPVNANFANERLSPGTKVDGTSFITRIQFTDIAGSVDESDGTLDINISILGHSGPDTELDIVLISGDNSDISGFSTQHLIFSDNTAQDVTITITDDMIQEGNEDFVFEIQNVTGGDQAAVSMQSQFTLTINQNDQVLIINEINANPGGDANNDGTTSESEDEFIEIVNTGVTDMDISGYKIYDTNSSTIERHEFPAGTIVPAGGTIVIFDDFDALLYGGGNPFTYFGGSEVQASSTNAVGFTNGGDEVILSNGQEADENDLNNNVVSQYSYGSEANNNESITRSPDLDLGAMIGHGTADIVDNSVHSPGVQIDDTPFITRAQFTDIAGSVGESDGTFDLNISILGHSGPDTELDVVFISGDDSDIDGFSSQHLIFSDNTAQDVTITITDDMIQEGNEAFVFEIQNVTGGDQAAVSMQSQFTLTISQNDQAFVINEIYADPHPDSPPSDPHGDANGDGTRSADTDEFLEFMNTSSTEIDISNYKLLVDDMVVHEFNANTVVPAGTAIVVFDDGVIADFGGGDSFYFGGSEVQVATSQELGLSNSSFSVSLTDDTDSYLLFDYEFGLQAEGGDDVDQSLTRDPDGSLGDPVIDHSVADVGGDGSIYSPGTKINGDVFATRVYFSSDADIVNEGDGTYNITLSIFAPDNVSGTDLDVVLVSGDVADLNGIDTVFPITFPAGSSADIQVALPIEDDMILEGDEVLTFEIQNVTGGNGAVAGLGGSLDTFDLTIDENEISSTDLIINEIHADPVFDISGDANRDGIRDASEDEFVELVNTGAGDLNISGYKLFDTNSSTTERHVFPANTIVPAGGAIVVFGGGTPTGYFGNSEVQTASTGSLGLTNKNETVILEDNIGNLLIVESYPNADINESINRNPDISGNTFVAHSDISGASLYSPGYMATGDHFVLPSSPVVIFSELDASVDEGDGTYALTLSIISPDDDLQTTVDVVLIAGDANDIDDYTTQQVTFPADDALDQSVMIIITDDLIYEGEESLTFEITNIVGAVGATIASSEFDLTIIENDLVATDLVLNEYFASAANTDANKDGNTDASEDQFLEFYNEGAGELDISGYSVYVDGDLKHVFPNNTILGVGQALVLFGGGFPASSFGNSIVQIPTESASLGLNSLGGEITIANESDENSIHIAYGEQVDDKSESRNPDITGDFDTHPLLFDDYISPGFRLDGSGFAGQTVVAFTSRLIYLNEGDGTYDIAINIMDEGSEDAQVEVALVSGDPAYIENYTTQEATFPGGTSDDQFVTITITDNAVFEGTQYLELELQNSSGGNNATVGMLSKVMIILEDNDLIATDLVINEVLPYPSISSIDDDNEVDANGDGDLNGTDDEFIELVNSGVTDLDISGWKINDGEERHVFLDNTIIPAGGAIVIFGGGNPTGLFGNSLVQVASTEGLGLSNAGDSFMILNENDEVVLNFTYIDTAPGVALTRSPDITGTIPFVDHPANPDLLNSGGESATTSPGTKSDGSFFIELPDTGLKINEVLPYPSSSSIEVANEVDANGDGSLNGINDEFIELVNSGVADLDISGWIISDGEERHVFSNNTIISAGGAIVVFGGGNPAGDFGNSLIQIASTGGLGLSNNGDSFTISNENNELVLIFAYNAENVFPGLAFTRSPDITGPELFIDHPENPILLNSGGGNATTSPGTKSDGSSFAETSASGGLIINEFHADPAIGIAGDANGDGTRDFSADEFVEFVNSGTIDIDISNWNFYDQPDGDTPVLRHTFPEGTRINAGGALVVFGGPTPTGDFGGAQVQVASTGSLSLTNSGDTLRVRDANGISVIEFGYAQQADGISWTRNPDITGDYGLHPFSNGASYSPGTMIDGTPFAVPEYTTVQFSVASGTISEDAGSISIEFLITRPDPDEETTFEVEIITPDYEADIDYTNIQSITFEAGSSEAQYMQIPIINDDELEGDELFELQIRNITGGNLATIGSIGTFSLLVTDDDVPLIFNEIHADPASDISGDANNDGFRDAVADEFIELANRTTEILDMSGWEYYDESAQKRHVFPNGTTLEPGRVIVVFGGGIPVGNFGGSEVQLASEETGLSLTNTGDQLYVYNTDGELMASTTYGAEADNNQSITKDPEITGVYVQHTDASGSGGKLYSPGNQRNGIPFGNVLSTVDFTDGQLKVYPNPVDEYLYIEIVGQRGEVEFILYDQLGKQVWLEEIEAESRQKLLIPKQFAGIYYYKIRKRGSVSLLGSGKLFINK